ncbi:hypothetical protein [Xylophilus sp. GOD-11R]|uniref:hypothetical protein n=1 Tax=Xylophilus sp. GOD-11R TaxID=3089814 RepID=UPI00298BE462|nr:hypothetical protein [Xylophilus sp. GOD-11R]WPB58317.1 hypothetical protein R9X41_06645 [Xylophilus sp. GOD-11R]
MANNSKQNSGATNHGQGRVTDPAHDGRLKENHGTTDNSASRAQASHGQGAVKDASDGRLKENRDGGTANAREATGADRASVAKNQPGSGSGTHASNGQGRVTDPAHDGRLKDNR